MNRKEHTVIKRSLFAVCALFGAGVLVLVGATVWTIWATSRQIAYGQAMGMCSDMSRRAQMQLAQTKEYGIKTSGKHCVAQEDELGATDYVLSAYFVLEKNAAVDGDITKADLDAFAVYTPNTDHVWAISNEVNAEGRSRTICAVASAYLNNDGKLLSQGVPGGRVTYHDPAVLGAYTSDACGAL